MISLNQISKVYGTKSILDEVSFHFPKGEKCALVGENGAGKSTLLNILCDLEFQDEGTITKPNQCVVGYLPQEPNQDPKETILRECQGGHKGLVDKETKLDLALEQMSQDPTEAACLAYENALDAFEKAGGYAWESLAKSILVGLGFPLQDLDRSPKTLSGGWRMRLELARLFLMDPDFLILDEPTNHLDLPSLIWVEDYLKTFPGTLLFVSHDRSLLNRLATQTLHLEHGQLKSYPGNYDAFLIAKELEEEQQESAFGNIEKKKKQLETFIDRFGAKASKAAQARSKQKQVDRLNVAQSGLTLKRTGKKIAFSLPDPPPGERILCTVDALTLGYDKPLSKNLCLSVEKGQKIAVIGANGIGKSTFLKTLLGKIPKLSGTVNFSLRCETSFFAQDQLETLNPKETVLGNILTLSTMGEREARSLLGSFLFKGDDVFKPVGVLSGGEKSRVGLALSLARRANFLLLDEPTNHLDMMSVDTLTEAIGAYKGTVLFVSHDRDFIDQVATHIFAMTGDGRSMVFEGQLADYERLAALGGFPNVLHPIPEAGGDKKPQKATPPPPKKESGKNRAELEKKIAQWEDRIRRLEDEIESTDGQNFSLLGKLIKDKEALEQELLGFEEDWLSLA